MSRHLSAREISACLAGDNCPEYREHLDNCAVCRAEFEQLRGVLKDFRALVRNWSSDEILSVRSERRTLPPPCRSWSVGRSSFVALLIVLLVFVAIRLSSYIHKAPTIQPAAAPATDTVLLEEVNQAASRSLPVGLAPLQVPTELFTAKITR